jgi:predicted nucleic acid-binding protein
MTKPDLFFDSSALFVGIVSASGASRALLILAEHEQVVVTVSVQVIAETERAIARKIARAVPAYREAVRHTGLRIVRDPSPEDVQAHQHLIRHEPDVAIVLAAMQAKVDYLVTLNRRHFVDDADVVTRSGLRIGLPGDALAWVREQMTDNGSLREFFSRSPMADADLDLDRDKSGARGDVELA